MGGTGKSEKYTSFSDDVDIDAWFRENSNHSTWEPSLQEEYTALRHYTAMEYARVNHALYEEDWDKMKPTVQKDILNIEKGLSTFELNKGITVSRTTDFKIFGASDFQKMSVDQIKAYLSKSGGVLQNDAFMSFSADSKGRSVIGSGLVIHLNIPPSKGAGAWLAGISGHKSEKEFLLNDKAVLKFDTNSIRQEGGVVHINADWLGQAKTRTIDPDNKSRL